MAFLLAVLAAAVAVLTSIQVRRGAWGVPTALAAAGCAVVLAGLAVWQWPNPSPARIAEKARTYQEAAAGRLGSYLASQHRNAATVVLSHPDYASIGRTGQGWAAPKGDHLPGKVERAFLDRAADGLDIRAVIHPPIPDRILDQMSPPSEAELEAFPGGVPLPVNYQPAELASEMKGADYGRALRGRLGECELLVILVPGVEDLGRLGLGATADSPRLALLYPPPALSPVLEAIRAGRVVAAVVERPGYRYDVTRSAPGGLDAAFAERYVLVTGENVDDLAARLSEPE